MSASVRTLRVVGLRAAIGPLAAVFIAARGAPGTSITVPTEPLTLTSGTPVGSMSGHRWVRAYSYAPRLAGPARAATVVVAGVIPGTVVPVPTSSALTFSGTPPNLSLSGQRRARLPALSFAPSIIAPARAAVRVYPAVGVTVYNVPSRALSLTGFAPIVATANVTIAPPTGQLSLTGITELAGLNIAGTVVVHLQPEGRYRFPPRTTVIAIRSGLNVEVPIPTAGLGLNTAPPLIFTTGNLQLDILPGQLALTPFAPTPTGIINIVVPTVSLGITGLFAVPTVSANILISPDGAGLLVIGFSPILPPGGVGVGVPLGRLVLGPFPPNVVQHLLRYRTPLSVIVAPHQTLVVVAPHQTTVNIA